MSKDQFDYSISHHNDICIIKILEPRIDSSKAPVFKTELLRLIAGGTKKIILNFQEVKYINSSGLGALTFGKRQLDEVGGEISVCCLQEKVMALFRIAKLDRVFIIYETQEEGLQ